MFLSFWKWNQSIRPYSWSLWKLCFSGHFLGVTSINLYSLNLRWSEAPLPLCQSPCAAFHPGTFSVKALHSHGLPTVGCSGTDWWGRRGGEHNLDYNVRQWRQDGSFTSFLNWVSGAQVIYFGRWSLDTPRASLVFYSEHFLQTGFISCFGSERDVTSWLRLMRSVFFFCILSQAAAAAGCEGAWTRGEIRAGNTLQGETKK